MGKQKKTETVAFDKQGPDTLGEGYTWYTWCAKCQATYEGEVCPGCADLSGAGSGPPAGDSGEAPPPDHLAPPEAGGTQRITPETRDAIVDEAAAKGVDLDNFFPEGILPPPLNELTEEFGVALLRKLQEAPEPGADPTTLAEAAEPAFKNLNDLQEAVKAAELNVKTRNTTESLKCILTDDEIRRYGIAQARANAEIATAEEELQSVKSQYKSRIDGATATRTAMAKRINNGYEFRPVECVERWDYDSNVITVLRTDTYETVSRRTMSREEMQRKLF